MARNIELTFWGSYYPGSYGIPRHRTYHETVEAAREEARRVHGVMRDRGAPTACHAGIICDRRSGYQYASVAG